MLLASIINVSKLPLIFHYSYGKIFTKKSKLNKNSIKFPPTKPISKMFTL